MSVRMALAKLCACACGGALVGGGAVHVAEVSHARHVYARHATRVVHRTTVARAGQVRPVVTQPRAACPPAVLTLTSQGAPIPLPPAYGSSGEMSVGGGGGGAAAVGGG